MFLFTQHPYPPFDNPNLLSCGELISCSKTDLWLRLITALSSGNGDWFISLASQDVPWNCFYRISKTQSRLAVVIKLRMCSSVRTHCTVRGSLVLTRLPSLLIPNTNFVVPKTTLTFDNLLEGLRKVAQSCCTYDYSFLQGKNAD